MNIQIEIRVVNMADLHIKGNSLIDNLLENEFVTYSDLSNYQLPPGIKNSIFTPPSHLRLTIENAEINNDSPLINCSIYGTGRYSNTEFTLESILYSDIFIHGDNIVRIDDSSKNKMLKLLDDSKITNLNSVTLRQYIDIVRNDMSGILDYSTLNNISLDHLKDILGPVDTPLFDGIPYEYQMDGIRWMWLLAKEELGLVLGDEMGLGKTFQIIYLFCLFKEKLNRPSIVVCPATLVRNWTAEIKKFAPQLTVYEHKGSYRSGSSDYVKNHDVVITSYETLISKGEMDFVIGPIEWSLVILDEAQAIKNPEARRTQGVKQLKSFSRIAVTGTPLENKLLDAWSLFDFSLPGFLNDLDQFEQRFPNTVDSAVKLESAITPFILRRLISDVMDELPEKIEIIHGIELRDEEYEHYQKYIDDITEGGGPDMIGLGQIQKLRVYCTHPNIYHPDYELEDFSKFVRLIELLSEVRERKQKAVVFTSFQGMIDRLCDFLSVHFDSEDQKLTPYLGYIDGRNSSDALQIIENFSKKDGFGVLMLNPRAAGTGLTITSANHVFHYNPEWNPALMAQATGRVYRIGQENQVVVHWMYCRNTFEEKIIDTLDFKKELFDKAIQGIHGNSDDEEAMIRALLDRGDDPTV